MLGGKEERKRGMDMGMENGPGKLRYVRNAPKRQWWAEEEAWGGHVSGTQQRKWVCVLVYQLSMDKWMWWPRHHHKNVSHTTHLIIFCFLSYSTSLCYTYHHNNLYSLFSLCGSNYDSLCNFKLLLVSSRVKNQREPKEGERERERDVEKRIEYLSNGVCENETNNFGEVTKKQGEECMYV